MKVGTNGANATVSYHIIGTPDDPVYVLATYTSKTGNSFASVAAPPAGYTLNYAYQGNKIALLAVVSGYASWAALNGAGSNLDDDHDGDGVSNGVEYFLGGQNKNTTGFTSQPGVTKTGGNISVAWTRATDYTGVYGTHFVVETSDTLANPWTPQSEGVTVTITGDEVKFTFPADTKNFVRLKVTGP